MKDYIAVVELKNNTPGYGKETVLEVCAVNDLGAAEAAAAEFKALTGLPEAVIENVSVQVRKPNIPQPLQITQPIRLIELFAGVGSQAMALRDIGANFETWVTCEWWVQPNASYKAIHCSDDNTDYSRGMSKETLTDTLFNYGISVDGKKPLTKEQIRKKPEKWQRDVYNNIKATKNIVDITKAKGKDLRIEETDKYTYILTYSFPCQDLSVAGKMAGMDRGSGTRSGMLWEVERLLKETENLPQVLLMENVPQVMQNKNIHNFEEWKRFLESKGYKNFAQILNAKDYGVAQNRARAFMISVLGNYTYTFPEPQPLEKCMADYLEDEVPEKYYVETEEAKKLITGLIENGRLENIEAGGQNERLMSLGYSSKTGRMTKDQVLHGKGVSRCLTATEHKHNTEVLVNNADRLETY